MNLIHNIKISADELYRWNSYKEIAPLRGIIQAQKILIEENDFSILVFEIEHLDKNIVKVVLFPHENRNNNNYNNIKKELFIYYMNNYANKEECCIALNNYDLNDEITDVLKNLGYNKGYSSNFNMNYFEK